MEATAKKLLRTALDDPAAEFRDGQWECIEALLHKQRMLVVQRTGWGKSMVYFLATRMLRDAGEGFTLLISPLLSLMRNQIQAAERIGIRAETINSTNPDDWTAVQEKLLNDEVDVLLISPERLANNDFREDVLVPVADRVGLFVVDEAHCISDWGHDFRPDYRRIVRVLQALPPNVPVLATTATASDRVVKDVAAQLGDLQTAFPPQAHIDVVIEALNRADDGLSVPMMQKEVNLSQGAIIKTLKFLDVEAPSPVTKNGPRWYATPVEYHLDRENIDQLCELRKSEQREMLDYMQERGCLMQYLARALDDPHAAPCEKCAGCLGRPLLPDTVQPDQANAAGLFLRRSHLPIWPRKRWQTGAHEQYEFQGNIGADLVAGEGRALSLWADAGWGQMVRKGKYEDGSFSDDLIQGCLQMIEAWQPNPQPNWLTCVPSLNHPELVPHFAQRLAQRLGIPFVPTVQKVKDNKQQKYMNNSFQQASNLDGAFSVDRDTVPEGPVFLIDDMVDSRWTLTVIAALLRQAGCPAVFPLALAMNSPSGA
jgi:hypothetical protein